VQGGCLRPTDCMHGKMRLPTVMKLKDGTISWSELDDRSLDRESRWYVIEAARTRNRLSNFLTPTSSLSSFIDGILRLYYSPETVHMKLRPRLRFTHFCSFSELPSL